MTTQTRSYSPNEANAKSVGTSMQIDEKGPYIGVFTRAEAVTSTKGTSGIEFDFKTNSGQTAKFLAVWTHKSDGAELSGLRMIDAILTCIGLRTINPTSGTVTKWDNAKGAEVQSQAMVFAGLMGKPIGLVLNREEYAKNDGSTNWKNALYCPFEATTRRIAAERIDNSPPDALAKIVATLKDKPLRTVPRQRAGGYPADGGYGAPPAQGANTGRASSGFDDMDDDIPF